MGRFDYYLHRSGGRIFDYFGGIGAPFKVSPLRFYLWKAMGYRGTKVIKGAAMQRVYVRAALATGAHRRSYKVEEAKRVGRLQDLAINV